MSAMLVRDDIILRSGRKTEAQWPLMDADQRVKMVNHNYHRNEND